MARLLARPCASGGLGGERSALRLYGAIFCAALVVVGDAGRIRSLAVSEQEVQHRLAPKQVIPLVVGALSLGAIEPFQTAPGPAGKKVSAFAKPGSQIVEKAGSEWDMDEAPPLDFAQMPAPSAVVPSSWPEEWKKDMKDVAVFARTRRSTVYKATLARRVRGFDAGSTVAVKEVERKGYGFLGTAQLFFGEDFLQMPKWTDADTEGPGLVMMEFAAGTLRDKVILQSHDKVPWSCRNRLLVQMLHGLKAMHTQRKFHGELTPDNLYIIEDLEAATRGEPPFRLKLGALYRTKPVEFTHRYAPPFPCTGMQSDVYSAGLIITEVLFGISPFDYKRWVDEAEVTVDRQPYRDLILRMAEDDLEKRINIFQAYEELHELYNDLTVEYAKLDG
mmetsp:Transcript_93371/g.268847  ORF Transcript_93371/g.268847 Transcript_93371/m.268847 type:complete len:390 (-) Transcript_93371:370-1539(-)